MTMRTPELSERPFEASTTEAPTRVPDRPGTPATRRVRHRLRGSECKCARCREVFTSLAAFDLHRASTVDDRRICLDPAIVLRTDGTPALRLRGDGLWERVAGQRRG
ncbi:FDXHR family putative zinc-binding protein [Barrientosiimonas humi]|uniref:FDXHR family putative zinc-binding protein n=1 Tax=Barrientosiimonas humi TaxID=999931 RepID=UPI003B8383C9